MFLVPFLSFFVGSSYCLSIPFVRRAIPQPTLTVDSNYQGNLGFSNEYDAVYSGTVYVQGKPFQVQIDTGSSDFWINNENVTLDDLVYTGSNATLPYGDGSVATGPIALGNVSFGKYTVANQAMILAPGSNASDGGLINGLIGVGPAPLSQILTTLIEEKSPYNGMPFTTNVFNQTGPSSSYMTFLLSRSEAGVTEGGLMTLGELAANYTEITRSPKLPVVHDGRWITWMDGIYVNGKLYSGHSVSQNATGYVAKPTGNQTSALLDSGTSAGKIFARSESKEVNALISFRTPLDIPGAVWNDSQNTYTLPCHSKINISMSLGGLTYPMDPIDATQITVNSDGSFYCSGAFAATAAGSGIVDFILGDSFMRNVYSLFYFGANFTGTGHEQSYMQILSTTDANKAWADFEWANIQRLIQDEYEEFQPQPSTVSAASEMYTYSLVSGSASTSAAAATTLVTSAHTTAPSQSASPAPASASSTEGSSPTSLTSATPARTTSAGAATTSEAPAKIGGELAADAAVTSASSSPDYHGLLRNSYIVIGLLAGAIVLLVGVLIKLAMSARNNRYTQVPGAIPPVHFEKPYERDSEAFSTPYDDLARPLPQ
ncbi:hypothetical protein POSPLADRAFT_1035894 [Postia placenta MAD-698-R-SB12]|uniref:Peptidase A1 domain-containing protein n=1 Tax=Postia placenta MAD-698-R-SB12 TaxID=670580 RepID=A0A1X6MR68_9APHY|nr:hypothetical protein POSPLADRAFT_1035894 [Postia placenta MAD-698-R-SB12]OSX58790.1 hypothetical protein POSPLADRAFT_1035894 [Postia placenta MAD-698-R-SB12]